MQVNRIGSTNFESKNPKQRYITDNMRSSIESILIRMNSEYDRKLEGDYFKSTLTTELHYDDIAVFEDERRLKKKVRHNEQMVGFSNLRIGKKTVLDIDNKTGEIIDYVKPFYKPWFLVIKQAEKFLSEMRSNFYDKDLVKKKTLTIKDMTPEAAKTIKKIVLEFEKQRLENVVKELENSIK